MNSVPQLTIGEIASTNVLTVAPDMALDQVLALFVERVVSSIIVIDQAQPLGIVTERDLLNLACSGYAESKPVREVMTTPLLTVNREIDTTTAQMLLANHGVRHLVILDDAGKLYGVVSETDFRRHLESDIFALIQNMLAVVDPLSELLAPDCTLADALSSMSTHQVDHLIIGRDGYAEGIITERDVPRLLLAHKDPASVNISTVMTSPPTTIGIDVPVSFAAKMMNETGLRHLVVVDADGKLIGVASQHRMLDRLNAILLERSRDQLALKLDSVLKNNGIGLWELDLDKDQLITNALLNEILDFSDRPLCGPISEFLDIVHADDRPALAESLTPRKPALTARFNEDIRLRKGGGEYHWFNMRGALAPKTSDTSSRQLAGTLIDIHAHKNAEIRLQQSEGHFRRLIEEVPLPLCHVNRNEELIFVNHHFIEDFGYTLEDIPNLTIWWQKAYPDASYRQWVQATWEDAINIAQQTGEVIKPVEYRVTCKDGSSRLVEISGITLGDELLATFVDVTVRSEQQGQLELSNVVLERISAGQPLAESLDFICRHIEKSSPNIACSVLLLDLDGIHLRHGAAPLLPKAFMDAVDGAPIGPASGSCGTAAYLAQSVFVGDIAHDPLWTRYKAAALENGLAACWSLPILSPDKTVLGTFAIYWSEPLDYPPNVLAEHVQSATALCALAIERQRRNEDMLTLNDRLSRAELIGRMGSWTVDAKNQYFQSSRQMDLLLDEQEASPPASFDAFVEHIHPEDQATIREANARLLAGLTEEPLLLRRHPDYGPLLFLQTAFRPRHDENGALAGYDGTIADVTRIKQNDERLLQQVEELRRWQQVMLGREGRVLELKAEVNTLLARLGEGPRYSSLLDNTGSR